MDEELQRLVAERAIYRVLSTYCRAVDRYDLELLRSCYWPDATDDHGPYKGDIEGFLGYVGRALARFERTNHFLGNCLIDVDLATDVARAETYAVAFHRLSGGDGKPTDMTAGLRYVDRFERREGDWRIAERLCAFEWRRSDPVSADGGFAETYVRGMRSPDDIVFHILG